MQREPDVSFEARARGGHAQKEAGTSLDFLLYADKHAILLSNFYLSKPDSRSHTHAIFLSNL